MEKGGVRRAVACLMSVVMAMSMVSATALQAFADEVESAAQGLVYDDVYGLVDGYTLMSKTVGVSTDVYGETCSVYQQDIVNSKGEVTISSVWSRGDVSDDLKTEYSFEIGQTTFGYNDGYLEVTDSDSGLHGVVSLDGTVIVPAEYASVSYYVEYDLALAVKFTDGNAAQLVQYKLDGTRVASIDITFSNVSSELGIWVGLYQGYNFGDKYLYVSGYTANYDSYERVYCELVDGVYQVTGTEAPSEVVTSINEYTAFDGTKFGLSRSDNVLTLTVGSDSYVLASNCSYYSVYGDLIVASLSGGGKQVFNYRGTRVEAFEQYDDLDNFTTQNMYVCVAGSDACIATVDGTVTATLPSLPDADYCTYYIAGDYVYSRAWGSYAEGFQSVAYNIGGEPVLTFDCSLNLHYQPKYDESGMLVCEFYYTSTNAYYSADLEYLGSPGANVYLNWEGALSDGTLLFRGDEGETGCYAVVDATGTQVTLGGYALTIWSRDTTNEIVYEYDNSLINSGRDNSAQRASADIYYARDADGNFGAVNSAGEVVIPFEYEAYYDIGESDTTLIWLKRDGAWFLYDTATGEPVEPDPEPTNPSYTDVDYDNPQDTYAWALDAITFVTNAGLITGYENGAFGVGDGLKREQLAVILWRYAEPEAAAAYDAGQATETTGQSDVLAGQYYTGAVTWAVGSGIIKGYEDKDAEGNGTGTYSEFGVDDDVTFEQLVTVLANFQVSQGRASQADVDGADASALAAACTDADAVSGWAAQSMAWGYAAGVFGGYDNGDGTKTIAPAETVKRERVAAVLYNLNGKGLLPV